MIGLGTGATQVRIRQAQQGLPIRTIAPATVIAPSTLIAGT